MIAIALEEIITGYWVATAHVPEQPGSSATEYQVVRGTGERPSEALVSLGGALAHVPEAT